jgi:protein phosphatase PTC1
VDLVRHIMDPQVASKTLVDHALARFSTDNLSCMIVRFDNAALKARKLEGIGVDHDKHHGGISEADAIVSQAKKRMETGEPPSTEMIVEEEEAEAGPEMDAEAMKEVRAKKQ